MTTTEAPANPATGPGWQPLLDAIATEVDPKVRHALELVAEHVVAEVAGDIDGLLHTLTGDPEYHIWGASSSKGPVGVDEVREYYGKMVGSGKNRLDYVLTRVVANASTVVTEGQFHHVFQGCEIAGRAQPWSGGEPQPGHWYHVAYQCLVVWPLSEDGVLLGEEIYAGEAPRIVREVTPEELPHLGPSARR